MAIHLDATLVRRDTLSQVIYDAIREAIVTEAMAPGSAVSEAVIARELNVSKTPVREALLRLKEIGLLEADGLRGMRVVLPSRKRIVDAYEARAGLEGAAASLSAVRATHDQQAQMIAAARHSVESAEANDRTEFRKWDEAFHICLIESAASSYLETLAKGALLMTAVLRARDTPISGSSIQCAREHISIADAIASNQTDAARALAVSHVEHVLDGIIEQLGDAGLKEWP
jgi:DNA-binding GntR family transcriptional regulator